MTGITIKFDSGKIIKQKNVNLRQFDFDWAFGWNVKTFFKNLKDHFDKNNIYGKIVSVNVRDNGYSHTING